MARDEDRERSKFLSLILRHEPEKIGLTLDPQGWVAVETLLASLPPRVAMDRETLTRLVRENNKQRFVLSKDGIRIRAAQGHSVSVDLGMAPTSPPETLFHGTAETTVPTLRREGLKPMRRQHVHLSKDAETARKVGTRHGRPVILTVRSGAMAGAGFDFWLSDNGVWLTAAVPVAYLDFPAP